MLLFGLWPENGDDFFGNIDFFLTGPARQLIRAQLRQDFLERQIDQRMVAVGGIGKDAGRCVPANFAEADFDAALGQLREDLLDGEVDANTA
jgi:hypothetical protein